MRGVRKLTTLEQRGYQPKRKTTAEARMAAYATLTDDQKEQLRQEHAEHAADMVQWRRDFAEHGPARAGTMLIERKAARGTDKIADFYARKMVEGDTDLNHDNLEAAQ